MEIRQIATIHTGFPEKFGIPRQSGIIDELSGVIVFESEYRSEDAVRGLEGYDYLWIIWDFSECHREHWSATVAPPRLGGRERKGVYATRSPYRPNPLGLSCVKLNRIEYDECKGPMIHVQGIDMLDGTPIYDIKPYLTYTESHPEARCGFADNTRDYRLNVCMPDYLKQSIGQEDAGAIVKLLEQDPRTAYIHDAERVWGMYYKDYNVRFKVSGDELEVIDIEHR